jgi:ribosomal protein S18 acetylase RimI-like enzyme
MVLNTNLSIRPVEARDKNQLAHLIHYGTYVHRHLDWKPPLDWIGESPFFVAENQRRILAALACPPDPPKTAWVRMFVCSTRISYNHAWQNLWPETKAILLENETKMLAAIPLQKWFRELLTVNDFIHDHNVVSLLWKYSQEKLSTLPPPNPFNFRPMSPEDLKLVQDIDSLAFGPLWRNAYDSIELAYEQAVQATVVEEGGKVIGYQITTPTPYGAHLGRLAIDPGRQGKGVGYALVYDLVSQLTQNNIHRITVNTQDNNNRSLGLYEKAGFLLTQEAYPVFLYQLEEPEI